MSYYREQLEKWLSNIAINVDSVLDVGGSANPVLPRLKGAAVKEYKIMDNGAEGQNNINYFSDINRIIDIPKTFDVVFCLEVFEYVYNPIQALENIASFLKPNGVAYISFPAIYPVHEPRNIDYLRYTKEGITRLLGEAGFTHWFITPRVATIGRNDLANFFLHEGMHPIKGNEVIYDIGYMVEAYINKEGEKK